MSKFLYQLECSHIFSTTWNAYTSSLTPSLSLSLVLSCLVWSSPGHVPTVLVFLKMEVVGILTYVMCHSLYRRTDGILVVLSASLSACVRKLHFHFLFLLSSSFFFFLFFPFFLSLLHTSSNFVLT